MTCYRTVSKWCLLGGFILVLSGCGGGSSGNNPSGSASGAALGSSTVYCSESSATTPGTCYLQVLQWTPTRSDVSSVTYKLYDSTGKVYQSGSSAVSLNQGFIVGGSTGSAGLGTNLGPNTHQVFYVDFTTGFGKSTFILNQPK